MDRAGQATGGRWALLVLWWRSVRRRGPSGPFPALLGLVWLIVPIRAVRHVLTLASSAPADARALLHASIAPSVLIIPCATMVLGREPLSASPRLALLPWAGASLRLLRLGLRSPFALLACFWTTVVFTVAHTTLVPLWIVDRALLTTAMVAGGWLVFLASISLLAVAVRRFPAIGFWTALLGLILTASVVLRPEAALEFPGVTTMASTLDPGGRLLSAIGRLAALLLVAAGAAGLVWAIHHRDEDGFFPQLPQARHSWLLREVQNRFGAGVRKEVALMWRATLLRNAMAASLAWAVFVAVVGIPFGLVMVFLFWLQMAFNIFAFDYPLGGVSRYRLLPGGPVAALHLREAVIHGVMAMLTLPLALVTVVTSGGNIGDVVGWWLMGHAAFSMTAVAGRFTSLARPKALHVWQFFVHGGVLTWWGYLAALVTLGGIVSLGVGVYAGFAAVVARGALARGLSLATTAGLLLSLHALVRREERRSYRIVGQ